MTNEDKKVIDRVVHYHRANAKWYAASIIATAISEATSKESVLLFWEYAQLLNLTAEPELKTFAGVAA